MNMNQHEVDKALKGLSLGALRFYPSIGSTNDEALAWAASNAPDLALVLAEDQTSGRGRQGRVWVSQPGSSLTFSLILRPGKGQAGTVGRYAFLGALALAQVLRNQYALPALVKWPNDVLVSGRKVCGILAETVWSGEDADSVVLGMGVNLLTGSVPPQEGLNFPAACLQDFTQNAPTPLGLLPMLLKEVMALRPLLATPTFFGMLRPLLAFRDETVRITGLGGSGADALVRIDGLGEDGSLLVSEPDSGKQHTLHQGEVHLLAKG